MNRLTWTTDKQSNSFYLTHAHVYFIIGVLTLLVVTGLNPWGNPNLPEDESPDNQHDNYSNIIDKQRAAQRQVAISVIQEGWPFVAGAVPPEALENHSHPAWFRSKYVKRTLREVARETQQPSTVWYIWDVDRLLQQSLESTGQLELRLHHSLSKYHATRPPPLGTPDWIDLFSRLRIALHEIRQYFPHAFVQRHEFHRFDRFSDDQIRQEIRDTYASKIVEQYSLD